MVVWQHGWVRAVIRTAGQHWISRRLPADVPGRNEILIEVMAAGLNHADLLMRAGRYQPDDPSWTVAADRVGFECAGTVRRIGAGVDTVEVGQPVMAQVGGACAEFVAVDHRLVLPVQEHLSWPEAAALPSALMTEYDALVGLAQLSAGERVLITGGSTGVGLVGVQLAKAWGAEEIQATTRSPAKVDLLRSLGADRVVLPGDSIGEYDVALDHLGGEFLAELISAAAPLARVIQIGRLAGGRTDLDLETLASRRIRLLGTTFRGRTAAELHALVAAIRAADLGDEPIRPVIDSVFGFDDAENAADRLAAGPTGKVVIEVRPQQAS